MRKIKQRTKKELNELFKKANSCKEKISCDNCSSDNMVRCLSVFKEKNKPVLTNITSIRSRVYCEQTSWAGDRSWTRSWISLEDCKECDSHLGVEDGKVNCSFDERLDSWTVRHRGVYW